MNERQRVKELEQLSAYLDGQLNETEKRQIASRLAQEPELREHYEGLRKTKMLFSRLSRVRAPRSFALTPEMVKVRKAKRPFYTSLRWATSLAAILLVVVFGAEFIFNNPLAARSAIPAEEPMLETALQDEAAMAEDAPSAKSAEPEPLILWGEPGVGSGGGGEAEAYGMGGGGGDAVEESTPLDGAPEAEAYTQEAQPTDLPTRIRTNAEEDTEGETPILGINPGQAGEIVSTSEGLAEESSARSSIAISPLRWAQIGLAAIVVTGVILLLVKRKA